MNFFLLTFLGFVALAYAAGPSIFTCDVFPCQEYTVVETNEIYEVHENEPVNWFCSTPSGSKDNLHRYTRYITGYNSEGERIPIGIPRVYKYYIVDGVITSENSYECYLIPIEDPPETMDQSSLVARYGRTRTYSMEVVGPLSMLRLQDLMMELLDAIPSDVNINRSYILVGEYQLLGEINYHEIAFLENLIEEEEEDEE